MDSQDTRYAVTNTPMGKLRIEAFENQLTAIHFIQEHKSFELTKKSAAYPVLVKASTQLKEYFAGDRKTFSLPLKFDGTNFEAAVWNELKKIPYGVTVTYKDIAKKLGNGNKVRAVGRANGCNPLPIVIPCHRVIGTNHKLVGYSGGIERKRQLLQLEGTLLI